MSGHSKWSTIKHKKGAADAKRGNLFTKLIKEITMSAKVGGGIVESNPRLRSAVLAAKKASMPSDNIDRAIKRGTGELEGVSYEQVTYEGYGPGGVALMIDALTDNKNRSAAEMRKMFENSGGNLGGAGSVGFMFQRKGLITIPVSAAGEDQMMNDVLDSGAENMETIGDQYSITTAVSDLENVKKALAKKYKFTSSDISMLAKDIVKVDEETGRKIINLMENLDDSEDVQKIYYNFQLPETLLKQ
jgi:YebC/PmpR family DNA-binding regulatory protein